jgi:uncharacterized protein (DUF488 family)
VALLRAAEVPLLVDVRRFPVSRRHPQFTRAALEAALAAAGIGYRHEPDLGGHREPRADSPNAGWRNGAFRGYADHMATEPFRLALERLWQSPPRTAVMCAEADPARCHRQLIADALVARGAAVQHLRAPGRAETHLLHPRARPGPGGTLTYPPGGRRQVSLFDSRPR